MDGCGGAALTCCLAYGASNTEVLVHTKPVNDEYWNNESSLEEVNTPLKEFN